MPDIRTIDLNYLGIPGAIAAYVILGSSPRTEPVLIETGPASTLNHLKSGLAAIGLELHDIRHALVTHIHLDHAGATGHLARNGTHIYVHEFGAKHLIDPSRLIDSATRIYGDQMERLWGNILPVPETQITAVHDRDVIDIGGLKIRAIETPGHARHHHAFAIDDICFVGDVAGISVPGVPEPSEGRFISVPTPPPEFDPLAWHASIERLRVERFTRIYLTHFGSRDNVDAHFELLHEWIDLHTDFVRRELESGRTRDEILQSYIAWNRREAQQDNVSDADFAHYVSYNLLTMNVDGILRYLAKPAISANASQTR
jgi:glyoxylase-like metal-dependent hydrolase (beta-lactamase superfamily II)